jgi:hypothetical protein
MEETTRIISEMYDLLPPELGVHCIVPNVVLAVAGVKADADIHWATQDKRRAAEHIDVLNKHLNQYGIRVQYNEDFVNDDDDYFGLSVISLKGLEYSTSRLKTFKKRFSIRAFYSSTGFEGFTQWNRDLHKAFEDAVRRGELTKEGAGIYFQGIYLGYPEKAIEDFEKCYRTGNIHTDLIEADILSAHPLAGKYHGAIPVYHYYPESAYEPEIVNNIDLARKMLNGFYTSDWMKKLSTDPLFIEMHANEEKKWDEYLEDMYKRRDARKKKT